MARYCLQHVEVIRETAKAVLVEHDAGGINNRVSAWLPKSQVSYVDEGTLYGSVFAGRDCLAVPGWLLARLPYAIRQDAIPV